MRIHTITGTKKNILNYARKNKLTVLEIEKSKEWKNSFIAYVIGNDKSVTIK
jgi:hypothetical protein